MTTSTRRTSWIKISDPDRGIDFELGIRFDLNGDGEVEYPDVATIESITCWFGKYGFSVDTGSEVPHALNALKTHIGLKYADEILAAVQEDVRRNREAVE